ncbi:hypothetical protein [Rhodococcus sp. NPDC056516]|uniref:hypothetical protein n=1 Tax=Rhodococcus sp. NPDC056516 TaxID=3345847 RepID=UPI00366BF896
MAVFYGLFVALVSDDEDARGGLDQLFGTLSGRAETVIHMRSVDLLYKSGAVSGPAPSNEKGIVEPFAIATITLTIARRTLFISDSPPLFV